MSGFRVVVLGQSLDLLDVKDGVSLHERDFALGIFAGLAVDLGAGDPIGVDDKASMLAFAHMGVKQACACLNVIQVGEA
jgi:hypothetical protein